MASLFLRSRDGTAYRHSNCLAGAGRCKSLRLVFAKRKNHSLFRQSSMQHRLHRPCTGGAKRGDVMRESPGAGTIEVAISGVTVRIGHDAPASTIAAVLQALRTGA